MNEILLFAINLLGLVLIVCCVVVAVTITAWVWRIFRQ